MSQTTTSSRLRPFKPTPFGRYTLLLPISTGGMGEIFLARMDGARGFEKLCVIKRILPHLAQDKEFVTRFVNEAKTLAKLSHGSIAQIQDFGMVDGTPFLAIEYVDGKDLRRISARMRDRNLPMPLTFVLFVMSRVLDALAYAHRKRDEDENEIGLVHRDVSPQNILISYEGEVKVIDFGLAKSTLVQSNTQPSIVLGKFLYMSPEQARHQTVDRRSDLYSVGLCLYELIAGKNPFDDIPPGELMHKVAAAQVKPLSQAEPLTPPAVAQVVMRALNPDPALRFQTAEEFRGRLMACLMDIDSSAGPESASRYMRDVFNVEHLAEKKLHATLREQLRPVDEPDTAVHLVVPPAGRPALEPVGPKRDTSPLSFKPTPTNRALNTDFSDKDRETMPGVLAPEGFNRVGEAETAQVGLVADPDPLPKFKPAVGAGLGIAASRVLEPTEPTGVGLPMVPPIPPVQPLQQPRPRASAPAPQPYGQSPTLPALPQVPGLTRPFDQPTDSTDPSLLPVAALTKRQEITKPASAVVAPAVPAPTPLDTLPPSGPHAVVAPIAPLATNAAAAQVAGPVPAAVDESRPRAGEAKGTSPVIERVPRAMEKSGPPVSVDTQKTKGSRPNLLIIAVPLLAVLGAGGYIGWDLYSNNVRHNEAEVPAQPQTLKPPPAKRHEPDQPTPPVVEKPKTPVEDDDLAQLDTTKPKPAPVKKVKEKSSVEKAIVELDKALETLGNEGGNTKKFQLKVNVMHNRAAGSMDATKEAQFMQDAEKLRLDLVKAGNDVVK